MDSGRRISEIIDAGPLPADRLLAIGSALAELVAAAHAASAPYGGLSPASVFASADGAVRLLDNAHAPISARREDDLLAVGMLLYAMATGTVPYRNLGGAEGGELPPSPIEINPRLPSGLVRLIQRCVHPRPTERFGTAEEIHQALREVRRAPGSLDSLLPAEHVSSSAGLEPPPRPPADERDEAGPEEPPEADQAGLPFGG